MGRGRGWSGAVFPTLAMHDHDPKTTAYEHKDDTEIQQVTKTSYSVLQPCSPHWPCTTTTPDHLV
ncbi:hypothetical protein J6590_056790 [Homalodisca vitripennis]|nr:hypothetical protein J6590_056790 [Homalodisca vitripennis]